MIVVQRQAIEARHGKAARMKAGQRLKLINTSGHQVVDCWAFCDPDIPEFMSMEHMRLAVLNVHARKGDTMYSNLYTPMLLLEEDTSSGAHDTLVAACSPAVYERRFNVASPPHRACATNLIEAMAELGLKIPEQPGPCNLFQHSIVDENGGMTLDPPDNPPGCSLVLKAE
jgi:uncharacterized protein YcgI (DUF1989 family)